MALRLLLDNHISPVVASQVRLHRAGCIIFSLHDWQEGAFADADDGSILTAAAEDNLTLVTYDLSTIPDIVQAWAEEERSHGGIVYVDERTIRSNDFGRLVRSLVRLWDTRAQDDWTNMIAFLEKA